MVLDDIRLYEEMWRAWTEVSAMPGVSAAVHVGRFGILVWDDRAATPMSFDISRYTGRWPIGPARGHRDRHLTPRMSFVSSYTADL